MRHINVIVLAAAPLALAAIESNQVRGVGPEYAKFFSNAESFTCISHPSIILKPSQVNDNYCDCPDGSDEPGTSACTHLSDLSPSQPLPHSVTGTTNTTNALPGFYCQNQGHVAEYVPFTFVNDGVCDYAVCCDGSDEWEGVGGTKCEDRCDSMGKEYRKKDEARQKAMRNAQKKRDSLVLEAGRARQSIVEKVKKLEAEISGLQTKEADAKARLEDIEQKEKGKVVAGGEHKGSRVTILAGLAKQRIDELREAVFKAMRQKEDVRNRLGELETLLAAFKNDYNPNFNDEGVKRAVKAWEDYAATNLGDGKEHDTKSDLDILDIAAEDGEEQGINWNDWTENEGSDVDALYKFEEYLPPSARVWLREKLLSIRIMLVDNGILADNTAPGAESRLVTDARAAFQIIADDRSSKEAQVGEQTRLLEKDYGHDDIFRALEGKCVSQDSGEYTYELCWLDRTTQIPKKGGGHTSLGTFMRLDTAEVDEEVGVDGRGLGVGKRITMVYENGQHCWNGPNRQTTVRLACAEKDEIWKVSELEKCVYQMDVGSPVACESDVTGGAGPSSKDEL